MNVFHTFSPGLIKTLISFRTEGPSSIYFNDISWIWMLPLQGQSAGAALSAKGFNTIKASLPVINFMRPQSMDTFFV